MLRRVFSNVEIEILGWDLDKNWEFRVIKTVETLLRLVSTGQDQLLKPVEIFSQHVETSYFNILDRDSRMRSWQKLRCYCNQDCWDLVETSLNMSRPTFETCRDFLATCWDKIFEVLRSRVSIKITSRQVETPKLR
jgi:hypothetical protein